MTFLHDGDKCRLVDWEVGTEIELDIFGLGSVDLTPEEAMSLGLELTTWSRSKVRQ